MQATSPGLQQDLKKSQEYKVDKELTCFPQYGDGDWCPAPIASAAMAIQNRWGHFHSAVGRAQPDLELALEPEFVSAFLMPFSSSSRTCISSCYETLIINYVVQHPALPLYLVPVHPAIKSSPT